jgi:hypothetical protein
MPAAKPEQCERRRGSYRSITAVRRRSQRFQLCAFENWESQLKTVGNMFLWVAIVYTMVHAAMCLAGGLLGERVERAIRSAGDSSRTAPDRVEYRPGDLRLRRSTRRGTLPQTLLRWCWFSTPGWIFGCSVGTWMSYAFSSPAGYGVGLIPMALWLVAALLWQCVEHGESPDLRSNAEFNPHPVIMATR